MVSKVSQIRQILLLFFLCLCIETTAQEIDNEDKTSPSDRRISMELGVTIGSHFVDRSYNYNYSNSNTQAGIGGFSLDLLFGGKFKFKVAGSNLDANPLGANKGRAVIDKNFNYMVSIVKCLHKGKYSLEYGISYLYFYERTKYISNGFLGTQFSSNDHYLGGHLRGQYLIGRRFGPYVDYYLAPLRLNNETGFGYNHNVSIGLSFKLF